MVQSGGQRWGWAELCVTGAGHHTGERASQLRGRLGWSGSAAARVMQSELLASMHEVLVQRVLLAQPETQADDQPCVDFCATVRRAVVPDI